MLLPTILAVLAAVALATAAAAVQRCRTLRRALDCQTVTCRLTEVTWARDVAARDARARERTTLHLAEQTVVAEAELVIDAAWRNTRQLPRGGTDG